MRGKWAEQNSYEFKRIALRATTATCSINTYCHWYNQGLLRKIELGIAQADAGDVMEHDAFMDELGSPSTPA